MESGASHRASPQAQRSREEFPEVRVERSDRAVCDFERLERVVEDLARSHVLLRQENEVLREHEEVREDRIRQLEDDLGGADQRRRNAVERLDVLISELDELEARVGARAGSRRADFADVESSAGREGV